MKTRIEKINRENPDLEILKKAGEVLKQGGVVAFPTETVYGLGADALNEAAAEKIYAAKGRPSDNPLIIHIAEMERLSAIAKNIPEETKKIAKMFWPGPLTMIFEKTDMVPMGTTGGLNTVAVRFPEDKIAREIIRYGGGFICAPSANISGKPSPTSGTDVAEDMDGKIEMILDGGNVEIGVESTILDMTVSPPMILRPGAITKEMLMTVLEKVEVDRGILEENSKVAPKAPGMKYRHYAPKAPLILVEGDASDTVMAIRVLTDQAFDEGKKVGVIASKETMASYQKGMVKCIGSRKDEATVAHNLFRILREFDREQVDVIYSEVFSEEGIGKAIMNRLMKAAGHQKIQARDVLRF